MFSAQFKNFGSTGKVECIRISGLGSRTFRCPWRRALCPSLPLLLLSPGSPPSQKQKKKNRSDSGESKDHEMFLARLFFRLPPIICETLSASRDSKKRDELILMYSPQAGLKSKLLNDLEVVKPRCSKAL